MGPSDLDEEMTTYDGVEDFSTLNFNVPEEQTEGDEAVLDTLVEILSFHKNEFESTGICIKVITTVNCLILVKQR